MKTAGNYNNQQGRTLFLLYSAQRAFFFRYDQRGNPETLTNWLTTCHGICLNIYLFLLDNLFCSELYPASSRPRCTPTSWRWHPQRTPHRSRGKRYKSLQRERTGASHCRSLMWWLYQRLTDLFTSYWPFPLFILITASLQSPLWWLNCFSCCIIRPLWTTRLVHAKIRRIIHAQRVACSSLNPQEYTVMVMVIPPVIPAKISDIMEKTLFVSCKRRDEKIVKQ